MNAVLYARVSSKDQEREGYSIPAQLKLLKDYAASHDFQIVHEFIDVETAKITGRKKFGDMVRFLEQNPNCRIVIVEKTDRLYRNFRDCVTLEDLGVEIHLPKEGQVIGKDSKSQAKLIHGIQVVIARNYIENLREEVRKGMREKAEQGVYPSRPPLGYRNNKLERSIEVDPQKAPLARRMFELYATGQYSLASLQKALRVEFGVSLGKSYVDRLLKNPFYTGSFLWEGCTREPIRGWWIGRCLKKCRRYSKGITGPSIGDTSLRLEACSTARTTVVRSRLRSKKANTLTTTAQDTGESASCRTFGKKNWGTGWAKL